MKNNSRFLIGFFTALCVFPLTANAHFTTDMGDFYGGGLHPLTDSRTLLLMAAFAVWTSQFSTRLAGRMLLLYVAMIPLGAFIGFRDMGLEAGPECWLITLGAMSVLIVAPFQFPFRLAYLITALLSVYTGYANVIEVKARIGKTMLYTLGLCLGCGLFVLYLAGFLLSRKAKWKDAATRISGAVFFVVGVAFFALGFPF